MDVWSALACAIVGRRCDGSGERLSLPPAVRVTLSTSSDMTRAFRRLARSPGYLLLSVLLLTAGVTSNALVYAAAEALLWNPFHAQASGDLYAIQRGTSGAPFRNDHFAAIRDAMSGSLALTGFTARDAPVRIGTTPSELVGAVEAHRNYFDVVRPVFALGRGFSVTPSAREVVISRRLWARGFASRRDVLGQTVMVHGQALTVVGVLDDFAGTIIGFDAEVFVPVDLLTLFAGEEVGGSLLLPTSRFLHVLARNTGTRQRTDLEARLVDEDRRIKAGLGIRTAASAERLSLLPASSAAIRGAARAHVGQLTLLVGAVAIMVFLAACANVVGLVIARLEGRRQELGIQVALGATRAHIFREELLEVASITALAIVVGLGLALVGQRVLDTWPVTLTGRVPLRLEVNARVALLSSCVAVFAVAASAVWPLWRASARRPMDSLAPAASRTVAPRTTGRLLFVCVQVAACTALAVASLLAVARVRGELARPLGFDANRLLAATIDVTQPVHAQARAQMAGWLPDLRAAAAALPGVESVSVSDFGPLTGAGAERRLVVAGEALTVQAVGADATHFSTLRMPLLAGRALHTGAVGEAVVNEFLWTMLRARGVSLGDSVRVDDDGPNAGSLTIVGVVGNARHLAVEVPPGPTVYLPVWPQVQSAGRAVFLLRTRDRRNQHLDEMRRLVTERLPGVPLWQVDWIADRYAIALRPARVVLVSLIAGGVLTLGLAMTGILALLSYVVGRSRREMGIRAALGATPARAYLTVASGVVCAALAGLIVGAAAGWAGSHLLVGGDSRVEMRSVVVALVVVASMLAFSVLAPALRARHWDASRFMRE